MTIHSTSNKKAKSKNKGKAHHKGGHDSGSSSSNPPSGTVPPSDHVQNVLPSPITVATSTVTREKVLPT